MEASLIFKQSQHHQTFADEQEPLRLDNPFLPFHSRHSEDQIANTLLRSGGGGGGGGRSRDKADGGCNPLISNLKLQIWQPLAR